MDLSCDCSTIFFFLNYILKNPKPQKVYPGSRGNMNLTILEVIFSFNTLNNPSFYRNSFMCAQRVQRNYKDIHHNIIYNSQNLGSI